MKAIVTGSFDPITIGHMELVKYASERYDTVYVVALVNAEKEYMFTMEQKKRLIELSVSKFSNVIADLRLEFSSGWLSDLWGFLKEYKFLYLFLNTGLVFCMIVFLLRR